MDIKFDDILKNGLKEAILKIDNICGYSTNININHAIEAKTILEHLLDILRLANGNNEQK